MSPYITSVSTLDFSGNLASNSTSYFLDLSFPCAPRGAQKELPVIPRMSYYLHVLPLRLNLFVDMLKVLLVGLSIYFGLPLIWTLSCYHYSTVLGQILLVLIKRRVSVNLVLTERRKLKIIGRKPKNPYIAPSCNLR